MCAVQPEGFRPSPFLSLHDPGVSLSLLRIRLFLHISLLNRSVSLEDTQEGTRRGAEP